MYKKLIFVKPTSGLVKKTLSRAPSKNNGADGSTSDMVFQGEASTLWQARYSAEPFNGFTFEEVSSLDELIAGAGVVEGATPVWAFAGLGLLGVGGTAAAAGAVASGGGG
ncbi:BapA/Bap/LapF family prefix-like domain-containing protein, partial [Pseudomonas fluorescens]